jgi:hypothetical protein
MVGGQTIAVPPFQMFPGLDKAGTVIDTLCEGNTLKLKPQVSGITTDRQHLKRVPHQ